MTKLLPDPRLLKVALVVPLDSMFVYLAGGHDVAIGQRVVVPFGRRRQVGIVVQITDHSAIAADKLKPILQAFCDEQPLDDESFALLRFCADYYQHPYGQALMSALPARLRQTEPVVTRKQHAYRLSPRGHEAGLESIAKRQATQRRIFAALLQQAELSEAALSEISSGWRKAIGAMQQLGQVQSREILAGIVIVDQPIIAEPELNPDQAHALQAIMTQAGSFRPWLLHGITGSGKTEVYIRLLQQVLTGNSGQALVLVPEINLTPQLEARFRSRLPQFPLVALHSNLGESERLQNWHLAQSGQARIVIGTRLAVFTPMPELRLVIVDEEHDGSYKQQDGMRYHARDVAMVRAQRRNIPIVLGSATPALETWYNAQTGKFGLLSLADRAVAKAVLPNIRCIDVSRAELHQGLSPILIDAMRERLVKGEQSLLFINRRGYSPVLLCSACYWIAPCMRCSSKLVVHLRQGRLRCHHCGHEEKIVRQCPSCGNPDLHPTGHGTQRLEQTLTELMPQARILRVDRDSTRRKNALTDMLAAVHADEVDILVGTQMLAKGHDFPNLTLVGVIDTDSALFSPDFRAAERLFAQLMQVAGRAGRAEKAGEVLIQTAFRDHMLFNALRTQDYAAYAQSLLSEREMVQFPPYNYMALLKAEANDFALVQRFLKFAADMAHGSQDNVTVYDPVRPQMERLKGMERGQLLMQADSRQPLQRLLKTLVANLREHPLNSRIRWAVDVDPLEF
jgi:primosomal protein N' (replication factor Y)